MFYFSFFMGPILTLSFSPVRELTECNSSLLSLSTLTVQVDGDGSSVPIFIFHFDFGIFCFVFFLGVSSLTKRVEASHLQRLSLFGECVLPPT
jgi:hypothetical protein